MRRTLAIVALVPALLAAQTAPRSRTSVRASRPEGWTVRSPDGRSAIRIDASEGIHWSLSRDGAPLLLRSSIGLTIGGRALGRGPVRDARTTSADVTVRATFYPRRASVRDHYEELALSFGDGLGVLFRAYDDAVAYRLTTAIDGRVRVDAEDLRLRFAGQPLAYLPFADCGKAATNGVDCFHSSFEEPYTVQPLAAMPARQAFLPALVDMGAGRPKLLLTESDLDDYPGLWVQPAEGGAPGLDGIFPAYPLEETVVGGGFPQALVSRRADYIAETDGRRAYPWRVLVVADRDVDLPATDVVYRLGGQTPPGDWSWLRPGKSQSEWLWDNILYDVPFVSGLNTDTYRSYIEFAEHFHTGYLFFDAGWSKVTDPLALTPGLDVPGLVREAREKGLGVVLWHLALAVDRDIDPIMDQLQRWGATGIMVDFMDRDDQQMVRFYRRVVEGAARRRLIVNFHGAYKPTGLERRFPNAVTREGIIASEYHKWSGVLTPEYEVTLPFIRGVAGPMDYEPGHMRNAQKDVFKPMGPLPMSQGTRMHQAAMYLLYESPYAKMGGNVSDYRREPEFTSMLAAIPTMWKETRVLDGRVADYAIVLREALDGSSWIGAMTDWTSRDLDVPLSFLPPGPFTADVWRDGPNAERYAADWAHTTSTVRAADRLSIHLAPGGGWVGRFTKD